MKTSLNFAITPLIEAALLEDVGAQDLSADLIPEDKIITAQILVREAAIVCGCPFAQAVFNHVNERIQQDWHVEDGEALMPNQIICTLQGPARGLLTAERTALNFLQTLSATATRTAYFINLIRGTSAILLDTRKTLPLLRAAQKYAVRVGGGQNHRHGLFDAIMIKENHIAACGSITVAMAKAKALQPEAKMIVEVENLQQLHEAIKAGAVHILLDNFSLALIQQAVNIKPPLVKLEASGGINERNIRSIAESGVDYISLGTLTKDIKAIDLSMRFT